MAKILLIVLSFTNTGSTDGMAAAAGLEAVHLMPEAVRSATWALLDEALGEVRA